MKRLFFLLTVVFVSLGLSACGGSKPAQKEEKQAQVELAPAKPSSSLLSVVVEGANYAALSSFKEKLRRIRGVQEIYQQTFDADSSSQLQVEYVGAAQALADAVQRLSTPEQPVEVLGFDPSKIEVRLQPL